MNLFTNDNPETTIKGLGFKTPQITKLSIKKINRYMDIRCEYQQIPGYPIQLLPHTYLNTKKEAKHYYRNQKMTRVLGLLNRATSVIKRTKDIIKRGEIEKSIEILRNWVNENRIGGKIPSCCEHKKKDTSCYRIKDKKVFTLPRKFKKSKCHNSKGFSMRSSCAPYQGCL